MDNFLKLLAALDAMTAGHGSGLHPRLRALIAPEAAEVLPFPRLPRQSGPAQEAGAARIAADPKLAAFPAPPPHADAEARHA